MMGRTRSEASPSGNPQVKRSLRKRLPRILFRTAIFLLLLPLMVVYAMFIYGKYMIHTAEEKLDTIDRQQERAIESGNGFGGEPGMVILDSGYRSSRFFWMDDEHLVFQTDRKANAPKDEQRQFVWNVRENRVKPLVLEGSISSFYDGSLHYARFSETELRPDGRKKVDVFRATLVEVGDTWVVEGTEENMADVLEAPSGRYELFWAYGRPWFGIKSGLRTEMDVPRHRFDYLWEWGWIIRTPWVGTKHFDQTVPEMGFIDIGGQVYGDQPGTKVAELVDLPPQDLINLEVVYIGFLDRFWVANELYGDLTKRKFLAFLDRNGVLGEVAWLPGWLHYREIPLPTRRGLFWGGMDYRLANPSSNDNGAFLSVMDGRVVKVIKGSAIKSQLTNDGCAVAFLNPPRADRDAATLKVFNVCNSTMDGKELTNVDYGTGALRKDGPGV